jgi:NADPH:quinone reductase-like Zn-dependent oxidoreductase
VQRHVLPLLSLGLLSVTVDSTYDFRDAASAYDAFQAGGKLGKILLTFPEE